MKVCRLLVSRYLVQHQTKELNGLSIRDAILPSYPDVRNMTDYCTKYVETMGADAEGVVVSAGILLSALQCTGCTVFLDHREDVGVTVMGTVFSHDSMKADDPIANNYKRVSRRDLATLHLLLRPGHYDLLYVMPELQEHQGSVIHEISKYLSEEIKEEEEESLALETEDDYSLMSATIRQTEDSQFTDITGVAGVRSRASFSLDVKSAASTEQETEGSRKSSFTDRNMKKNNEYTSIWWPFRLCWPSEAKR